VVSQPPTRKYGLVPMLLLSMLTISCVPPVGNDQVAVRFYPPPGQSPAIQQMNEATCKSGASGYVKLYVECMQARGYQPEIVGQGGMHMTVMQLPDPPPGVRPPAPTLPPYSQPQVSRPIVSGTCEYQGKKYPNGAVLCRNVLNKLPLECQPDRVGILFGKGGLYGTGWWATPDALKSCLR
jgi:hypothetical protein